MRLEMGLETKLALQQKLVLAPQILQSIEILQMPYQNLLDLIEEQVMENEALERDMPEAQAEPGVSVNGTKEAEEEASPTEAEVAEAPAGVYAPEEWDEYRPRRHDAEDGDKKLEALANSPGRPESPQDLLADQLRMIDAPPRVVTLAGILVYNLDDDGLLRPHPLAEPLLDSMDASGALTRPLADIVAAKLGIAAVKVPEARRGVTPEQIAEASDERERNILDAQEVLSRIQRIRATENGRPLTKREILLRYPLVEILERKGGDFTLEEAEAALRLVQELEPRGVGGRIPSEMLVLQLDSSHFNYPEQRVLIEDHLDDLEKNRLQKIAREMNLDIEDVKVLIEELRERHLALRPGSQLAPEGARAVHPDVVVEERDGEFTVDLVNSYLPSLTVRSDYVQLIGDKTASTEVREHARKRVESARWLIDAIQQRQRTLTKVAERIFSHQRAFLSYGPPALRPLKMQTVADELGIHVSTVSRAIADKWVQTPHGIRPLKSFFVGGTEMASGEVESRDNVKVRVKEIIEGEDAKTPLSDDEVAERLREQGLDVARRTVTKYRKQLGISSSRQRKSF